MGGPWYWPDWYEHNLDLWQSTTACCPRETIPDSCSCPDGCNCLCADCDCGNDDEDEPEYVPPAERYGYQDGDDE